MNRTGVPSSGAWRRMALCVAGLTGWRRAAFATAAGALTAAALPPVHAVPVLLVSFPALVWLIDGSGNRRAAFAAGWWFGFGGFLAGLYWVGLSFQVDAAKFGSYGAIAVVALAAGLAVFPALAALLSRLAGIGGAGRIPVLAAAWTGCEWLRGTVLTGFPWNPLGTAWAFSDAMIQLAALTGCVRTRLVRPPRVIHLLQRIQLPLEIRETRPESARSAELGRPPMGIRTGLARRLADLRGGARHHLGRIATRV